MFNVLPGSMLCCDEIQYLVFIIDEVVILLYCNVCGAGSTCREHAYLYTYIRANITCFVPENYSNKYQYKRTHTHIYIYTVSETINVTLYYEICM
jgi:hypothetical protein